VIIQLSTEQQKPGLVQSALLVPLSRISFLYMDFKSLLLSSSPDMLFTDFSWLRLLIFYCLSNFFQNVYWYVSTNTLGINYQQLNFAIEQVVVIDYSNTTSLSCTGSRPPYLSTTAASGNYISCFRVTRQPSKNAPRSSSDQSLLASSLNV